MRDSRSEATFAQRRLMLLIERVAGQSEVVDLDLIVARFSDEDHALLAAFFAALSGDATI